MGRKKLEIKRIESKSRRQVTFTKRRNGLMKKAKQLSILCDVDVALIVYSARGKLYNFSSSNNSLKEIIQRYHNHLANESAAITEPEQEHSIIGTFQTVKDLLDAVERHLEPGQLSTRDFICLEDQLEAALRETRARKTHLMMADVKNLEEQAKLLIEENRLLTEKIAVGGEKMDKGNGEFDRLPNQTPVTLKFL